SFMPEERVGVVVLANTDGPAGGWVDILASEVYDAMLGDKAEQDVMAKFLKAIDEGPRKRPRPPQPGGENPAIAKAGLSQPASAYVGQYTHPTLGALTISLTDGKLVLTYGEIKPQLVST